MKSLLFLNKYLWKYRGRLFVGFFFVILSNIFGLFIAPLVRKSVNIIASAEESIPLLSSFSFYQNIQGSPQKLAFLVAILILISALLKGVFMFFMRQTIIVASRHIEYDLKNEVFDQYQNLDQQFFVKNYTGDLMNRISEDVSRVRQYVGPAVMYTINIIVLFVLVIGMMISINPKITVLVLIPLPVMAFMVFKVSSIINQKSDVIQSKLSDITTYVQESLSGIRVLKAFAVDGSFYHRFEKESEDYRVKNMSLVKTNSLFMPSIFFLVGFSILITIWVGGKAVIDGEFTYGNIAEFILYVNMLTWPMISVGWVTSLVQRAAASQSRINEFLNEKPEFVSGNKPIAQFNDSIVVKDLVFSYPGTEDHVLDGISFEIQKGQHIGIIGNTGCGKSTLAALLTRTYEQKEGEIWIDGTDLREVNQTSYRKIWGYVPQDVFLFSDSVRENISFGLAHANQELIEWAATMADIHDDILKLQNGYDTIVGERGVMLSGGQKQRLSIARALVKKPALLLLDDSLSAVDTKTEAQIKSHLKSFAKDTTLITFSHRISTIEDADVIMVMDEGKMIEKGSKAELIASGGMFADLYHQQTSS